MPMRVLPEASRGRSTRLRLSMRARLSSVQTKLSAVIFTSDRDGGRISRDVLLDASGRVGSARHRGEGRDVCAPGLEAGGARHRLRRSRDVREVFDAVGQDADVRALALYESSGLLLHTRGQFIGGLPTFCKVFEPELRAGSASIRAVRASRVPGGPDWYSLHRARHRARRCRERAHPPGGAPRGSRCPRSRPARGVGDRSLARRAPASDRPRDAGRRFGRALAGGRSSTGRRTRWASTYGRSAR